jgi:hypothetical protein
LRDRVGVELSAGYRELRCGDALLVRGVRRAPLQARNPAAGGEIARQLSPVAVVHQQPGIGIDKLLTQLRCREPPAERDDDRADTHARELDLEDARIVLGEQRDAVSLTDPIVEQHARQPAHPILELSPGQFETGLR